MNTGTRTAAKLESLAAAPAQSVNQTRRPLIPLRVLRA